jgi:very-short-patch-repair endonuclease
LLWQQLKNKKLKGYDFDRQKIIGNYIVDFYSGDCGVVIEIDGSTHDSKVEYDEKRNEYFEKLGLVVIHILAKDVLNNLSGVLEMLDNHPALLNHPAATRHPSTGGE